MPRIASTTLLSVAALSLMCGGRGEEETRDINPSARATQAQRCDISSIGRAEVLDTTNLTKVVREGLAEESAEGATFEGFFDDDVLKRLTATYYGEMGRTSIRYYFDTPQDFLVSYVEAFYAQPIYAGPVEIVSYVRQYFYFCGGALLEVDRGSRAAELTERLRTVLPEMRP